MSTAKNHQNKAEAHGDVIGRRHSNEGDPR